MKKANWFFEVARPYYKEQWAFAQIHIVIDAPKEEAITISEEEFNSFRESFLAELEYSLKLSNYRLIQSIEYAVQQAIRKVFPQFSEYDWEWDDWWGRGDCLFLVYLYPPQKTGRSLIRRALGQEDPVYTIVVNLSKWIFRDTSQIDFAETLACLCKAPANPPDLDLVLGGLFPSVSLNKKIEQDIEEEQETEQGSTNQF